MAISSWALCGQEPRHVEGLVAEEDVVHRSAQLVGQDGQGFRLAMLRGRVLEPGLRGGILAKEEHGGLREGPLQMRVADLRAGGAGAFAAGLFGASDQPSVGREVLDGGETMDVVDLVEDDEGEDLPDAGNGPQAVEGVGVMLPGGAEEVEFQRMQQSVIVIDEGQVDLDAPAHDGVGEMLGHGRAIGCVGEVLLEGGEVGPGWWYSGCG